MKRSIKNNKLYKWKKRTVKRLYNLLNKSKNGGAILHPLFKIKTTPKEQIATPYTSEMLDSIGKYVTYPFYWELHRPKRKMRQNN